MSTKGTAALLAVFIVLCAAYWLTLKTEKDTRIREYEAKKVFSIAPDAIRAISVQRTGEAATVATRDAADAPWAIAQPYAVDAFQSIWNRLADTLANLANERTIDTAPSDLAQYQLDQPRVIATATTADGKEAKVELGALDPTQTRAYARTESQGVFLVPKEASQLLDRPLLDLRNRSLVNVGNEGIARIEYARIAGKNAPEGIAPGEESELKMVIEKQPDGSWRLVEPVQGFANKAMADKLASQLQFLVGRNYVDHPESLSDYGLDPPSARVTVATGKNTAPQTVFFGSLYKGDDQGGIYVKQAAAPAVFVVDSDIITHFPKTPDGFRDARLFTRLNGPAESIRYVTGKTDIAMQLDPERGWRVASPPVDDSDQVVISNFISLLKVMTGSGFPPEEKPEFGLATPAIEVSVTVQGQAAPARICVGAQVPGQQMFYVRQDTGAVMTLNRADVNALTRTLADFRVKQLLRFDKAAATQLDLRFDGTDYAFEKVESGAWHIKTPAGKVWESQSDMDALLGAVAAIQIRVVESESAPEDPAQFGFDAPLAAVRLTTHAEPAGDTALGPLVIGKSCEDNSQQRFAAMQGRADVFRIDQAVIDAMRDALRGVRDQ